MAGEALRIREVRGIDRIVGECLELWFDAQAWQTHLLREGARLLGLRVGLAAEMLDFQPGQKPRILSAIEYGWDSDRQRDVFLNSSAPHGPEPFSVSPVDMRFRSLLGARRAATRVRQDLISDRDWFNHMIYNDVHRPAGMDEIAYSAIRLASSSRYSVLAFGGDESRPGGRQRRALALLHREIMRRTGKRLAGWSDIGRHSLSPRQQEVFDLLLTGMDEKSIVARLHRSRSTVTQHISAIYAQFNVTSRTELLAMMLCRSRGNRRAASVQCTLPHRDIDPA